MMVAVSARNRRSVVWIAIHAVDVYDGTFHHATREPLCSFWGRSGLFARRAADLRPTVRLWPFFRATECAGHRSRSAQCLRQARLKHVNRKGCMWRQNSAVVWHRPSGSQCTVQSCNVFGQCTAQNTQSADSRMLTQRDAALHSKSAVRRREARGLGSARRGGGERGGLAQH